MKKLLGIILIELYINFSKGYIVKKKITVNVKGVDCFGYIGIRASNMNIDKYTVELQAIGNSLDMVKNMTIMATHNIEPENLISETEKIEHGASKRMIEYFNSFIYKPKGNEIIEIIKLGFK